MSKFEKNLSQGNVGKQLMLFAMPFLLSNLIQSLYNVADMIIVGQYAGTISMSGVNIGSQATFVITTLVIGLSAGGTVLIGQYMGSGNKKALKETIGTLFLVLLVLSVVFTFLMLFFADKILAVIKTPIESFPEAKSYFLMTGLGIIFIFSYNALSAVMRGMGDSKNPLIFVSISCFTNIALDLIFVAGFGMRAFGAALATVISQALSAILCIIFLSRNEFVFDFKLSSFKFYPERLAILLKIGIPTSIQNVSASISFLFLTTLVNTLGVTASAAVGAVGKLNSFGILPSIAMSASVSAMCAQNIGAKQTERAVKTMQIGMLISVLISLVIFTVVSLYPEYCLRIFGNDAQMIESGKTYLKAFRFDYLIVPFLFCLNGLFVGSGHTTFSLINSFMSSLLIRIPMSYIFGMVLGYELFGVGVGAPLASVSAMLVAVVFFFTGRWKKMTIIK